LQKQWQSSGRNKKSAQTERQEPKGVKTVNEIEKAISLMETNKNSACTTLGLEKNNPLYDLAIKALQEKQERENPQPLTLEQLKSMDTKPVYCAGIKNKALTGWGLVCTANNEIIDSFCDLWQFEDYEKEYVSYAHKPEQEEK
jgi:hypothetical protein